MNDKTLVEMLDAVGTRDNPVEFYGLAGLAKERIKAQATRIEALEAALRDMVDAYVCNVDSFRTGGFYSDPRKDDCVINAEAALEGTGNG